MREPEPPASFGIEAVALRPYLPSLAGLTADGDDDLADHRGWDIGEDHQRRVPAIDSVAVAAPPLERFLFG